MATNYQRGRAREYTTKKALEAMGYECTRSASSQGLWDVVGIRADGTRLVQTKLTKSGDFSEDENCRLLRALPVHRTTTKELWLFLAGEGLVEVRNLHEPRAKARSPEWQAQRAQAQDTALHYRTIMQRARSLVSP